MVDTNISLAFRTSDAPNVGKPESNFHRVSATITLFANSLASRAATALR